MQINREVVSALARATDKSGNGRPVLAAIYLDGKGKAFAANGYLALVGDVTQDVGEEPPVLVSAVLLDRAAGMAGPQYPYISVEAKDKDVEFRFRRGTGTLTVGTEQALGTPPNYQAVIPARRTPEEGVSVVYLSPSLLQIIAAAAKDVGAVMIRLQIDDPTKAVRLDFGDMYGVIVPMQAIEVTDYQKCRNERNIEPIHCSEDTPSFGIGSRGGG